MEHQLLPTTSLIQIRDRRLPKTGRRQPPGLAKVPFRPIRLFRAEKMCGMWFSFSVNRPVSNHLLHCSLDRDPRQGAERDTRLATGDKQRWLIQEVCLCAGYCI